MFLQSCIETTKAFEKYGISFDRGITIWRGISEKNFQKPGRKKWAPTRLYLLPISKGKCGGSSCRAFSENRNLTSFFFNWKSRKKNLLRGQSAVTAGCKVGVPHARRVWAILASRVCQVFRAIVVWGVGKWVKLERQHRNCACQWNGGVAQTVRTVKV